MNNEEKILQILMQMQSDVTELKQGQAVLEREVSDVKQGQTELKTTVAGLENSVMRIEIEHGRKLTSLFDSYKQLYEISQEIRTDIASLKSEQGKHDLELKWLHAERKAK